MNDIIKDPHNIRSGQEWFSMLPKQLQERWLFYVLKQKEGKKEHLFREKNTFRKFIFSSFVFAETDEGHDYWYGISEGYFGVNQKKSLWSKIINFFKL